MTVHQPVKNDQASHLGPVANFDIGLRTRIIIGSQSVLCSMPVGLLGMKRNDSPMMNSGGGQISRLNRDLHFPEQSYPAPAFHNIITIKVTSRKRLPQTSLDQGAKNPECLTDRPILSCATNTALALLQRKRSRIDKLSFP